MPLPLNVPVAVGRATITKTREAQPAGTYRPTAVDAAKASAEIRVIASDRRGFTIACKAPLPKTRGVTMINPAGNVYAVTERALDVLRTAYSVACDF